MQIPGFRRLQILTDTTGKRVINYLSDIILTWHWVAIQSDLNNRHLGIPYCRALKIRGMNPYYYIYIYLSELDPIRLLCQQISLTNPIQ
jgi:hypothetical protein